MDLFSVEINLNLVREPEREEEGGETEGLCGFSLEVLRTWIRKRTKVPSQSAAASESSLEPITGAARSGMFRVLSPRHHIFFFNFRHKFGLYRVLV